MIESIEQYRPVLDWVAAVLAPAMLLAMGKLWSMLRETKRIDKERADRDLERQRYIDRLVADVDYWREELRKDSANALEQFNTLRNQVGTLRSENLDQQREMRDLHKQVEAGERENVRLRDENGRLRAEVARLRAEVEHLTAQLAPGAMK